MLLWLLLSSAFCADGFRVENRTQLAYGRDLVIPYSPRTVVMYFTPAASHFGPVMVWNAQDPAASEWRRGQFDGWRWLLRGVTYEDEGKYTQHDSTNHILSSVILTVREERHYVDRRVNDSMTISLRVPLADAGLVFIPEGGNQSVLLVHFGKLADGAYQHRLQLGLTRIVLESLSEQDSGLYELRDRHLHLVSTTRLRVSESDPSGNPYLGLLALLGVGGGIFCCVRKSKCCQKNKPPVQEDPHTPDPPNGEGQVFYHAPPNDPSQPNWTGPAGPPPNWTGPAGPPPNWTGPAGPPPNWIGPAGPPPNWTGPAGPPPNWIGPGGPPANWTEQPQPYYDPNPQNVPNMYPPPQPQWNPACQTAGYTPVMYSSPPADAGPVKEDEKEPTATDSLTEASTEESCQNQKPASPSHPLSSDTLLSSDQGVQFQISMKESSTHNPLDSSTSETENFLERKDNFL
ncbi:hypothetical protein GJAV_G00248930 [Gymnothorax javanicus]|nr:hypothetical protein GJAV_G00248930 [Gymnothorax javanicus]